jgi:hypothetical protein
MDEMNGFLMRGQNLQMKGILIEIIENEDRRQLAGGVLSAFLPIFNLKSI